MQKFKSFYWFFISMLLMNCSNAQITQYVLKEVVLTDSVYEVHIDGMRKEGALKDKKKSGPWKVFEHNKLIKIEHYIEDTLSFTLPGDFFELKKRRLINEGVELLIPSDDNWKIHKEDGMIFAAVLYTSSDKSYNPNFVLTKVENMNLSVEDYTNSLIESYKANYDEIVLHTHMLINTDRSRVIFLMKERGINLVMCIDSYKADGFYYQIISGAAPRDYEHGFNEIKPLFDDVANSFRILK